PASPNRSAATATSRKRTCTRPRRARPNCCASGTTRCGSCRRHRGTRGGRVAAAAGQHARGRGGLERDEVASAALARSAWRLPPRAGARSGWAARKARNKGHRDPPVPTPALPRRAGRGRAPRSVLALEHHLATALVQGHLRGRAGVRCERERGVNDLEEEGGRRLREYL